MGVGEWKKSRGVWLGLWEQAVQAGSPGLTVGGGEALLERKQRQRAGLGGEGLGGAKARAGGGVWVAGPGAQVAVGQHGRCQAAGGQLRRRRGRRVLGKRGRRPAFLPDLSSSS